MIEGEGWKTYIHQRADCGIQQVRIRYGFEALCGRSLFDVHVEFLTWLFELGFTVQKETVSRVDLQVMTTRPVSDYFVPIFSGNMVRRFRQSKFYTDSGDIMSSWSGGTALKVRIYDKRRELVERGDELKAEMIAKYCTGGVIPFNLTRIEFSLTRDILNDAAVDTMDDLKEIENSLVKYLTQDWFRILEGPKSKGNEWKSPVNEAWREVQQLFERYFPGGDNPREFSRNGRDNDGPRCNATDLKTQAAGCLASAVAFCKGTMKSAGEVADFIMEVVGEYTEEIYTKSRERAARLRVLTGFDASKQESAFDPYDPKTALNASAIPNSREVFE